LVVLAAVAVAVVVGLVSANDVMSETPNAAKANQTTSTLDTPSTGARQTPTVPSPATVPTSTTVAPSTTVPNPDGATGVLALPAVTGYLQSRSGDVTAAFYDVANGQTSLWRPGVSDEYTASIVKVDILATLLHQAQTTGGTLTANEQALAGTMIEQSDDDSADALWAAIAEAPGLTAFDRLLGLTDTVAGRGILWGTTTTTAADQLRVLKTVAIANSVLTEASRTYELNLMEHVDSDQTWGVSSGPPAGTTIAVKNGWLPLETDDWQVNSIGWIDGDGRDYLVAVLTKQDDTEGYGIDTIEGLSSLVWQQLGAG
jgi:hypothetical protein